LAEILVVFRHPSVPPTGRRVRIPTVVVMGFDGDKVSYEHIYWDQASVLVQIGLLDRSTLPVAGVEQAARLLGLANGDQPPATWVSAPGSARQARGGTLQVFPGRLPPWAFSISQVARGGKGSTLWR
jgi:hypothetical protein